MEFSKVPADQRSTDRKTWGGRANMMWLLSPGEEGSGGGSQVRESGPGHWAEGREARAG